LIWLDDAATATSPVGVEGFVVSAAAEVVAHDCVLWTDVLLAPS
jgi:hypothetical protein